MLGPNEEACVIGNRNCKWKQRDFDISQVHFPGPDVDLTITLYRQFHAREIHAGAAAAAKEAASRLAPHSHQGKFWLFSVLAVMHIRAWAPSVRQSFPCNCISSASGPHLPQITASGEDDDKKFPCLEYDKKHVDAGFKKVVR
ncbi:hypothetical protein E4U17_004679 [Claviceps sp. LM77 group G4]|nr:hypothetical protein E4U17_004679 [Claviceps sp. LM77 group G4]